jgi:outer membrane protein OmpU
MKKAPFPLRIPLRRAYLEERGKNMKKLLLATSILAGTAGMAAAEITLSGDARMGFLDDFVFDDGPDDIGFTSRARVTFTFSGETDGGLAFGASFRADNSSGASEGEAGSVFIGGAFGKISMGDVDGAALAAVGHVDGVGLTGLGDRNESAFIANGGLDDDDLNDFDIVDEENTTLTDDPSVLYEFTTGNVGLFASVTNPGHVTDWDFFGLAAADVEVEGEAWALGANYTMDAFKLGIGYEDLQVDEIGGPAGFDADHIFVGADGTFGAFTARVRYGTADVSLFDGVGASADIELDQWSLSGTYAMDAISVTGFYANRDFTLPTALQVVDNVAEVDTIGLGASYDLGGGASVVGGIVDSEETYGDGTSASDTAFDLGVSFSF